MIASASVTPRANPEHNQDAVWHSKGKEYSIMAVADGLGSFDYADLAAQYVCEGVAEYIHNTPHKTIHLFDMYNIFMHAQQYLVQQAEKYLIKHNIKPPHSNIFGTTLIVAVETEEEFICGYCGNGGIFHIRGNFDHFQASQYLPWNAVNYLNPHTVQNEQGKEALYKLLSFYNNPAEYTPTIIRISKDNILYGDILMICTDGIFSNDQIQIGKDSKNNIWIQGEATIASLCEFLKPIPKTEKALQEKIQQYLAHLHAQKMLDDDATLAICVSQSTLDYHRQK